MKLGLKDSIEQFQKYEGKINNELYLFDILRALTLYEGKAEKLLADPNEK